MRIVTPKEIRRIDHIAIATFGVASITLMENAGSAVVEVAKQILNHLKNTHPYRDKAIKVCVVCGKGNNGGDGLVVSRHLINKGFHVDTYILEKISELKGDSKFNLSLLGNKHRLFKITNFVALKNFVDKFDYDLVIDAIFGTGFSGDFISEPIKTLISFLNTAKCKIISIDIPSGLNGLSGVVNDVAIKAGLTVTLGLPKKGLFLNKGPFHTGKLIVRNIGFPKSLLSNNR